MGQRGDAWGRHHTEVFYLSARKRQTSRQCSLQHWPRLAGVPADQKNGLLLGVVSENRSSGPAESFNEILRHRGDSCCATDAICTEIFKFCHGVVFPWVDLFNFQVRNHGKVVRHSMGELIINHPAGVAKQVIAREEKDVIEPASSHM